jgi:glycosyltransferase domain-containing protein
MKNNFTLVIPTYNRPAQLARLLNYLVREKADFSILILDSSASPLRSEVKQIVNNTSSLSIRYLEFDETIKPFDKFYEGLCQVKTEFSQLCADDDFILVGGIRQCIDKLKSNSKASVVHGYYFSFLECEIQGGMDITQIVYYSPTIDSPHPLVRLKDLFSHYQALTYGVYRTPILVKILSSIKNVEQILARELLASALAVVYGTAIRLPILTHGRSSGPSQNYQCWHPLEWLFKAPQGLFSAYQEYKSTLATEILNLSTNTESLENINKMLDLIHVGYLLYHTPSEAFGFLLDKTLQGDKVDDLWRAAEVQIPLTHAANKIPGSWRNDSEKDQRTVMTKVKNKISRLYKERKTGKKDSPPLSVENIKNIITQARSYRLHTNFFAPPYCDKQMTENEITQLTMALDNYC